MFVRTGYFTGDPARLGRTLDGLSAEAVGLLSAEPGYRGYGLFANRELGVFTMGSWWEDAQAERDSDAKLGGRRAELVAPFAGTVAVDVWEAAAFAPPGEGGPGGGFRLVQAEFDPAAADRLVGLFRERTLPALERMDGFVGGALLIQRERGRASVGAVFRDRAALEASRGPQAEARARVTSTVGVTVRSVEEFEVVVLDRRPPQG
ncbi:antibiotic biosynthesis monooxygenase [Kitasatospora sp. NPDC093550]|uniref:antibiotic biosynthesis monooxygenase n=1 Tax=Kitasatospora sp. NPDC093550 TaxID=3364089 RepID=UPI00380F02FC